jgi:PKD domain-containing protein
MSPTIGLMHGLVLVVALAGVTFARGPSDTADGCTEYPSFGNIAGSRDTVVLSGRQAARCGGGGVQRVTSTQGPEPYYTEQIVCSTDPVQASAGLCSATPCPTSFFALRTIHFPDGRAEAAGSRCVTLGQAVVTPGVTAAQVFAAVRQVRLPGGQIGVTPAVRGLANLTAYFWVQGANQPPVDLPVAGSTVHAEFRVLEYRWSFGEGRSLVTTGPGRPGLDSEVSTSFPRRGRYRVTVTVMWAAQAWLDGRRVGQVDGLASQAQTSYPVAELRTVLTG